LLSFCLAINYDLEDRINAAVFPGHQGGPHNHTITALAVALKQAQSPEFKEYQQNVLSNNQAMAQAFLKMGYELVSGGTDNHLILVDLRSQGINGQKVEKVLESANVALNKNTVPGDVSAMNPGGIRLGAPALTTRGLKEKDFEQVAQFVHRGIVIAKEAQSATSTTKLVDFKNTLINNADIVKKVSQLKEDVAKFARQFAPVGFTLEQMKYK